MRLIDTTYFQGELSVANVGTPAVQAYLNKLIDLKQFELLEIMLGYDFAAKLAVDGVVELSLLEKDIVDGATYVNAYGQVAYWKGLRFTKGDVKFSPIANLAYCDYLRDNATATTASGEKAVDSENSSNASSRYKFARAWNEMVKMNIELSNFMFSNTTAYPWYYNYDLRKSELLTRVNHLF